jgi:hypothetical protein
MAIFKTIEDFLRKSVYTGPLAKEKPTRAPGSAKFKPTNTSGSPASLMKGKKIYKPNQIGNPEPYAISDANSSNTQKKGTKLKKAYKQDAKNKNLSPYTAQKRNPNAVPGKASTSNSKNKAPSYKTKTKKKQTTKKKDKTKERYRAGPTMTSMGGMRKSGTLRGKYVK